MNLNAASPPLHRRHDSTDARKAVRERYTVFQEKLPLHVASLQKHKPFLEQCQNAYKIGYKDWMILGVIQNVLIQPLLAKNKLDNEEMAKSMRHIFNAPGPIKELLPPEEFCTNEFRLHLHQFNLLALRSYGFEVRRQIVSPATLEKLLGERLLYFELDLPHQPLFGDPIGEWPEITVP